jgi:succinyl-CoA synthetase alpha subunit
LYREYVLKRNTYQDSVTLMRVSQEMASVPGVARASVAMATEANLQLMRRAGLLDETVIASSSDLLAVVEAESKEAVENALAVLERALAPAPGFRIVAPDESGDLSDALAILPGANLAVISVPGEYAGAEALKALKRGLNVMVFSNRVPLEQECCIKEYGDRRGLLVMGPDAGTCIIDGVPLGFANAVRRGPVGLVGASGTGLQEVSVLVHRLGGGISQAIGVGSRDLHERVGARSLLRALDWLAADDDTKVVVVLAKQASAEVRARVISRLAALGKPTVVNFPGSRLEQEGFRIIEVSSFEEAARQAVFFAGGNPADAHGLSLPTQQLLEYAEAESTGFARGQRYVRGLFSGGSLAQEAESVLAAYLGRVYSNLSPDSPAYLADPWESREHSVIDFGADEFTAGRPHPMIDLRLRAERIVREAHDPSVAVILLDVILGYGAHPDPAGGLADAITEARRIARVVGRKLVVAASVCGTEGDPQDLVAQERKLREAGALVLWSSTQAAHVAGLIARSLYR